MNGLDVRVGVASECLEVSGPRGLFADTDDAANGGE
jgi:hypothetical protein